MARTTTRNFLNIFRKAGITFGPRAPKMSDDVQLVSVLDDWSPRREGVPRGGYYGVSAGLPAGGTNHSIIELECRNRNGIIVIRCTSLFFDAPPQPTRELFIYTRPITNRETFTITRPDIPILLASQPKAPDSAIASGGTITDANLFLNQGMFNNVMQGEWQIPDFFLSFERYLYLVYGTQAQFSVLGFYYLELPGDDPPT
ncbi:MAG: hypothetical protein V3S74_09105 [Alphaproteobacteria bacterium]